jgi:hypothetical protein
MVVMIEACEAGVFSGVSCDVSGHDRRKERSHLRCQSLVIRSEG